jgi:RNA-directed DNA polymerase
MKQENVLERIYDSRRLRSAWQQVKRNAGAAGIDQMTVKDFELKEEALLLLIQNKLKAGNYRFKPARRVLIPKPGSQDMRKLGIPVIMDRIASQSIHLVFEEIFDPDFTSSNYGFRRGRSQHQAIGAVRERVVSGYDWQISIDLKSYFDEIPHELVLKLIRRKIRDERVLTLIARALKAGVITERGFEKTVKGSPQGSPVSPIISNIVLNEMDQELEKRGHKYCRWADDFIIFVKSKRAGLRVEASITKYLAEVLGLPVNQEKSFVASAKKAAFLGFQLLRGKIRIGSPARTEFKSKVKELTRRNNPLSMYEIIKQLNQYLRGWMSYYRIQESSNILKELDEFVRNRLRSMQLKKWKKPGKFQRILARAGYGVRQAKATWVAMNKWRSNKRKEVKFVLSNSWFRRQGLVFLSDYVQNNLEFQFNR